MPASANVYGARGWRGAGFRGRPPRPPASAPVAVTVAVKAAVRGGGTGGARCGWIVGDAHQAVSIDLSPLPMTSSG
jgi:hypothetical protein